MTTTITTTKNITKTRNNMKNNWLVRSLDETNQIEMRGVEALSTVAPALRDAVESLGYSLTYDPGTPPDIIDVLGVWVPSTMEGAALGGFFGLLLGSALGDAEAGAVVGAILGGVSGAARGNAHLRNGLRLRGRYDGAGQPVLTITRV